MTVGIMLPTKNPAASRSSGMSDNEWAIRERAAFAQTAPSAMSTDRPTILSLSVASVIGGKPPCCSPAAFMSSTYTRMSASGLPVVVTPSRSMTGPWVTPSPRWNRPPEISCR